MRNLRLAINDLTEKKQELSGVDFDWIEENKHVGEWVKAGSSDKGMQTGKLLQIGPDKDAAVLHL